MSRPVILFLCLFFPAILFGQATTPSDLSLQKPLLVKQILRDTNNLMKIFIDSHFAEGKLTDTTGFYKLKYAKIRQVDLVYSQYRESKDFDQQKLNFNRLKKLQALLPEIFKDKKIEWNLIEQTDGKDAESASHLFHGFVFWLERDIELSKYKTEKGYLEAILDEADKIIPPSCTQRIAALKQKKKLPAVPVKHTEVKKYLEKTLSLPALKTRVGDEGYVKIEMRLKENGQIDTISSRPNKLTPFYTEQVVEALKKMEISPADTITNMVKYVYNIKVFYNVTRKKKNRLLRITTTSPVMVAACTDTTPKRKVSLSGLDIKDSTVLKVLERNSHWNNMLVVGDFTGSMSPYSAQLLIWYQLMLSEENYKVDCFTFFNDGNTKSTREKVIGATGGIYSGKVKTMEELKKLAYTTMEKGTGGDQPENNIEALLEGIKQSPASKDIIMIADNFATPRDMVLLKSVSRPVKIILCGTQFGINTAYLDIARATGGSVHTLGEDVLNLASLKEGEKITIDGDTYVFTAGKFVPVKEL